MSENRHKTAILLAGGGSSRFGELDKMFVEIEVDGFCAPVFIHSLIKFSRLFNVLTLVVSADKRECFKQEVAKYSDFIKKEVFLVDGGESRMESVYRGLENCSEKTELVAVHDCARPYIKISLIERVLSKASESGGAIVASPMTDTVKKVDENGQIVATLNREELFKAETPQIFLYKELCEGYENVKKAGKIVTDDAAVMEFYGKSVYVVSHFDNNRKITFESDIF